MSKTELLEVLDERRGRRPDHRRAIRAARSRPPHPARRRAENALALETLEALAEAVEELAADEEVRLVAITGAGSADLLGRCRPEGARGAARRGGRRPRRGRARRASPRLAVPTVATAERPRRRRRDRPGAGVRLAHRASRARSCASSTTSSATRRRGARPSGWRGSSPPPVALRLFATCELVSIAGGACHRASSTRWSAPHRMSRSGRVARRADRARQTGSRSRRRSACSARRRRARRTRAAFAALWDARADGSLRFPHER